MTRNPLKFHMLMTLPLGIALAFAACDDSSDDDNTTDDGASAGDGDGDGDGDGETSTTGADSDGAGDSEGDSDGGMVMYPECLEKARTITDCFWDPEDPEQEGVSEEDFLGGEIVACEKEINDIAGGLGDECAELFRPFVSCIGAQDCETLGMGDDAVTAACADSFGPFEEACL